MSSMKENLYITRGHPFEKEWDIDFDIFGQEKIDPTKHFQIYNNKNELVLDLEINYGLTIVKFHEKNQPALIVSIFETDILENGTYTYSYKGETLEGRVFVELEGTIEVSSSLSDTTPEIKRQVRPWDLLRSKKPGGAGERASDEKQEQRMSICQQCPRFVKLTSQCLECGCIMNLKTKLEHATCPLGKW